MEGEPYLQEEMVALVQPVKGAPDHHGRVGGSGRRRRPSPLDRLLPVVVVVWPRDDDGVRNGSCSGISQRAHGSSFFLSSS